MTDIDATANTNAVPSASDTSNSERTWEATLDARLEGLTLRARRVLRDARHAIERRDVKAAVEFLDRAKAVAGEHPEYLRFVGMVLHFQHRHDEAVAFLRKALDRRPSDPAILANLTPALREGGCVEEAARTKLALTTLLQAYELVPALAGTWRDLVPILDRDVRMVETPSAGASIWTICY